MVQNILELRGITKILSSGGKPLTILDDINLTVEPGEFVAILGPSGSGKSTMLGLMAGLDRPTEGEILFQGRPIQGLSEDQLALLRRDHIGFVFQSFQLLGHMTARENIQIPLDLRRVPNSRDRADALLDAVGLSKRGHHYPTQLSGGEQQRVALARAFAAEPTMLLADEPTGNLDSKTGRAILGILTNLLRTQGSTLVLVTHDPAITEYADRAIYLKDGRIDRDEHLTPSAIPLSTEN